MRHQDAREVTVGRLHRWGRVHVAVFALAMVATPGRAQDTVNLERLVEEVAARRIPPGGPGCTIGITRLGTTVTAAFGAADMERGMPLTPTSIIEAGSVSKQFTAAAVVLLALDGKLTLDDDIRRYFPELPSYGQTITIRHLLTHTSGLRDWGAIAALEGWPRGTRAYTNAHVLDIASRQRALNHPPGAAYSYTNTGYNLLALLVERVSGKTFAEFTRDRLFLPLGMQNTSWRDDHRRLVVGRAIAYSGGGRGGFAEAMPNEDAHGNGGLLTTVRDLLVWNDAMDRAALGQAFADSVTKNYVLAGGRRINYALGINVVRTGGVLEVNHSGSTGGYRAYLVRYPDAKVSVAVLCNGASLNATAIAADLSARFVRRTGPDLVGDAARPALDTLRVDRFAGIWMDEDRRLPTRLTAVSNQLHGWNNVLRPNGANRFSVGAMGVAFGTERGGVPTRMLTISAVGDTTVYLRVAEADTSPTALAAFAGSYASDEVHGEPFTVAVENGQLVMRQTPSTRIALTPAYRDAFTAGGRIVWFTRAANGRVTTMFVGQDRAWAVPFSRQ